MYYINTFFLYSIIGHLIEGFFYTSKDSGILYGYWTPVYGIGCVIIIGLYNLIIKKFKVNKMIETLIIFLIGSVFLTFIEYIGGLLIEKLFHKTFWNYSHFKFNIGKYISLEMALVWGISAIILIYLLKPLSDKITKKIPKFLTWILIILFIIDIIFTSLKIK